MPLQRSCTIFGKRNTFTHTICLRDVGVGVSLQSADLASGRYPSCHPPVYNSSHEHTNSHVRQIFLWNVYRASMCRAYAMSPDCRRAHSPRNGLIPSGQGGNVLDRPAVASICMPQLIFFFSYFDRHNMWSSSSYTLFLHRLLHLCPSHLRRHTILCSLHE